MALADYALLEGANNISASISVSTRACHMDLKRSVRAKAGFDSQAESCEERSDGLLFFFLFFFLSFSLFFFVVKEGGKYYTYCT